MTDEGLRLLTDPLAKNTIKNKIEAAINNAEITILDLMQDYNEAEVEMTKNPKTYNPSKLDEMVDEIEEYQKRVERNKERLTNM